MKYIGNGNFLPDVPARDLTKEEVKKYGKEKLLASGLYVEAVEIEVKSKVKATTTEDGNLYFSTKEGK